MSDIKVSEMPEASELNNNDLLMVVQNGINKKAEINKLGILEAQTNLQQQITEVQTNLEQQILEVQTNLEQQMSEDKTNIEEKINKVITYSAEEINTGKIWIDGKQIYRVGLTISDIVSGQTKSVSISSYNFRKIVNMTALGVLSDGSVIPIPYLYAGNSATMYEENSNIRIASTGFNITNVYITLEYTKND